jgi:WD40 repeat protein
VNCIAFSRDGRRIVSGSYDKTVRVWDAATGSEVLKLRGHTYNIVSVAFSPDGSRIASGSLDRTVMIWDAISGAAAFSPLRAHTTACTGIWSVDFSADGSRIICKSTSQTISYDASSGSRLHTNTQSDDSLHDSINISRDGWVMDWVNGRTLCQLPSMVSHSCYTVHKRSVAVGTKSGRLFVIHFPPVLFTSADTCTEGTEVDAEKSPGDEGVSDVASKAEDDMSSADGSQETS